MPDDKQIAGHWDAGDLGCGEMVIELRARLLALAGGETFELTARDPGVPQDLPAWCRLTGHTLTLAAPPRYLITRRRRTSTSTMPASPSTRRCLDAWGWAMFSRSTRDPTDSGPSRNASTMRNRLGSPRAENVVAVTAAAIRPIRGAQGSAALLAAYGVARAPGRTPRSIAL